MARIISFEGRQISVPDDATDAEVQGILNSSPSAAPAAPEATQSPQMVQGLAQLSTATQNHQIPKEPASSGLYVAQQADRGLADVAGLPVDLMTAGVNLGLTGADKIAQLFGGNVDTRISDPFMGSDWIANRASDVNEAVTGNEAIAPDQVGPGARLAGAGARGASAALFPGLGLATKEAQGVKALTDLAKPYASSAGATLARDAVAGAGAGVGQETYDQYAPDMVKDSFLGPLLKAAASLMGGVGAAGLENVAEGTIRGTGNMGRNAIFGKADPAAPVNPATGQPFNRTEMDQAATVAQQMPSSRAQTVANIDDNAREFSQFAGPGEIPTTGMLADDIGMGMQENILRAKDPQRFAERDANRRSLASSKVDASAPKNADPRAFTGEATRQYDETLGTARQGVEDATAAQTAAQTDIQRQNTDLREMGARQPQASERLASEFDTQHRAAQTEKNARYASVADDTPVDGEALYADLQAAQDGVPRAARSGTDYSTISGRIANLMEDVNPETGDRTIRDLTYGDMKVLRAEVNQMRQNAIASGGDVTYLDRIGNMLSQRIDETNPEAATFYRDEFAPKFRTGKAGEYVNQTKRAAKTGNESSATRPSEFGNKFLTKPEDAASLQRAIDVNGNPVTAQNASDWMMGDLAKSGVLTDNAEIRFDKFRQWADKNRGTIDQFPAVRQRVDQELARAQQGQRVSSQLGQEVAAARTNLQTTEGELRRSALQSAIGNSPENAVASIMGSGDPEVRMAEMVQKLSGNKEASDGLKAATRDWIKQKAGVTSKIVGDADATRLSRANLDKLFTQHEKTLSKIYTPEEMNALRQAHKLMGAEAKLDVRATAGSSTLDKMNMQLKSDEQRKLRVLEAGLKAKFGVLKGGGVFRTINLFLSSLPDGNRGLSDLLFEMQFNPELAKHLLTRPLKDVTSPTWNAKLNKLLAVGAGARESNESRPK